MTVNVRLRPLSADEFAAWCAISIPEYADEKVRAGHWTAEEALQRSQADWDHLLPDGVATPGHLLFAVTDAASGAQVGVLWVADVTWGGIRQAFVYDIVIFEPYRRQGYGTQALLAVEDHVRDLGIASIGLHVFGHNPGALALYQKLGYAITDINMSKRLSS